MTVKLPKQPIFVNICACPLLSGPQDKVPVVRHPAIGTDADRRDTQRFFDHALEGIVIFLGPKNLHSPNAAIEHVKQHPPGATLAVRGMTVKLPKHPIFFNICACPLYPSLYPSGQHEEGMICCGVASLVAQCPTAVLNSDTRPPNPFQTIIIDRGNSCRTFPLFSRA